MLRNIIAIFVGLIVGMSANMAIIQFNMLVLFPIPEGVDFNDPAQLNAFMSTLPTGAFLMAMLAHLTQAFVGGWSAARLGASHPIHLAGVIGVVSLAGGISAMTMIDGPAWMIVELPLYLVLAWCAGKIEVNRRAKLNP